MSVEVVVVDDDLFVLDALRLMLLHQGYFVRTASRGADGLRLIRDREPDILILDINLPDTDGLSLCRKVRTLWKFPLLMLTARTESIDKVVALEVGADDYLTKPFEPTELIARVRALLRRSKEYSLRTEPKRIVLGSLAIEPTAQDAFVAGIQVGLTHKEFCLLQHLAENVGRAVMREALFEHNWGDDFCFNRNSLDVHIYRLRKKIEQNPANPRYLHTIRGYGYKLEYRPS